MFHSLPPSCPAETEGETTSAAGDVTEEQAGADRGAGGPVPGPCVPVCIPRDYPLSPPHNKITGSPPPLAVIPHSSSLDVAEDFAAAFFGFTPERRARAAEMTREINDSLHRLRNASSILCSSDTPARDIPKTSAPFMGRLTETSDQMFSRWLRTMGVVKE